MISDKKWKRTHYSDEITPNMEGREVVIAGWVHEIRDLGGVSFVIIRDRKGKVQLTAPNSKITEEIKDKISSLNRESVVSAKGKVSEDERAPGNFEIIPNELYILSEADSPLPLDVSGNVKSELDTRLNARFMDLRREEIGSIFKIRSQVFTEIRNFLESEEFIEITTPKMVATATEGGTELFPISYFGREAFLNQSPQLYKQIMMATGLDRVYEIGPIFRAEEHDTVKHLNETTSIDIESAFSTKEDVMCVLERLIFNVYKGVKENCQAELKSLDRELDVPELPLKRLDYDEALNIAKNKGADIRYGDDFTTEAEKMVGEKIDEIYFITGWPADIKPFYVQPKGESSTAFDLMHPRFELSSGAQRVHDKALLEKRLRKQGLNPEDFEFYLDSFDYGMPPHSGWGLGAERLLMAMTGASNIREVVMFPRDRRRLFP